MGAGTQSGLRYKVFAPDGRRIAACAYASDAARLVAVYGNGTRIKVKVSTLYTAGVDGPPAAAEADTIASYVLRREFQLGIDLEPA